MTYMDGEAWHQKGAYNRTMNYEVKISQAIVWPSRDISCNEGARPVSSDPTGYDLLCLMTGLDLCKRIMAAS